MFILLNEYILFFLYITVQSYYIHYTIFNILYYDYICDDIHTYVNSKCYRQYPDAPELLSFPKFSAFTVPNMILLDIFMMLYMCVVYFGVLR